LLEIMLTVKMDEIILLFGVGIDCWVSVFMIRFIYMGDMTCPG
jgi:hypothetical protein